MVSIVYMKIKGARYKKVNGGVDVYKRVQLENLKNARRAMGDAINRRAKILAPYDDSKPRSASHLKDNGRVVEKDGKTMVMFGDYKIPYARIHELGGMTGRGYRTHIVAKHYLERSGDQVAKEGIRKYISFL